MRDKENKHRFTAADILITVVVLALAIGAAVLFLFPKEEEKTAVPVQVTMVIHLSEEPSGIAAEDRLFCKGGVIGTVRKIDRSANNVVIYANLEKDDGVYLLLGEPVRINGVFVLETRLRRAEGIVESIDEREA